MLCPSCSHDNREGRRFCSECAAPLEYRCPTCSALNEPDERFCGECAAPLTGARDAGFHAIHYQGNLPSLVAELQRLGMEW